MNDCLNRFAARAARVVAAGALLAAAATAERAVAAPAVSAPAVQAAAPPAATWQVADATTRIVDPARQREIGLRIHYPLGFTGAAPVILVSHGGMGSDRGEQGLAHLGRGYAAAGFLAVHIGHRTSADQPTHRRDRPADVSFVIDALSDGRIAMPQAFGGRPDLDRIGHAGHSWGAYTAHAVAGARFDHGRFRDPRVRAIVALSPQGPDQFGSFDRGETDNSWRSVEVPAFVIAGETELNGPPAGFRMQGWRAQPFVRYPAGVDAFLAILPGQDHADIGGRGAPPMLAWQVENTTTFFDAYLRGAAARACDVGRLAPVAGVRFERRLAAAPDGAVRSCPP
jgi:predicted dienelactone hydrolase